MLREPPASSALEPHGPPRSSPAISIAIGFVAPAWRLSLLAYLYTVVSLASAWITFRLKQ